MIHDNEWQLPNRNQHLKTNPFSVQVGTKLLSQHSACPQWKDTSGMVRQTTMVIQKNVKCNLLPVAKLVMRQLAELVDRGLNLP
jgi:hypothetical protein